MISFFSQTEVYRSSSLTTVSSDPRTIKIPFTVSMNELIGMGRADARLGGLGVFFSGVTLGSLVLFLIVGGWRGDLAMMSALVIVTATTLLNPQCWWARFVPQSGLWPIFLLIPCFRHRSKLARLAAPVLSGMLLLNNLLLAGAGAGASFYCSAGPPY